MYSQNDGEVGHDFMRTIEPIASKVPYMTCPGNHEKRDNYCHYDTLFSMLGDTANPKRKASLNSRVNNHYYSMNIGPAHVIMFSTEFYFYPENWEYIQRQYKWLENDLKQANKNRKKRPFIIVMGHRSLYCLRYEGFCDTNHLERYKLRVGVHWGEESFNPYLDTHSEKPVYGLEELFYKYGVDLLFFGHEHNYLRTAPMYNFTAYDLGEKHYYKNPQAPIHITTGSAVSS